MRICAFEVRADERERFAVEATRLGVRVDLHEEVPSADTAALAQGCEGVTILGQGAIDADLLSRWAALGVRFLSTRTVGVNHIDLAAADALGIQVCNAGYPPSGVAEFTVMLMLMCLRHYKQALWRGQVNDFSLAGLEGRELGSLTVGVLGAGSIGCEVLRLLSGFGCELLACSRRPSDEARSLAECVSRDELFARSDVVSLHMPLTDETYHLIDRAALEKMRDGVVIVNCARGALADMESLIWGIESGKIGALGLDVVEGEEGITHIDHRVDILANRQMAYLRQFRNVVMTPHMAFYTDVAVAEMVRCGVEGLIQLADSATCPTCIRIRNDRRASDR